MRVTSAESTELFVGPPDAPLQVVRVGYADAAAGEKVRVDGDGFSGEAEVPPGDGTVEVPVRVRRATVGERRTGQINDQGTFEFVVAEPGWTMHMISHFHYDPVWWNTQGAYTSVWAEDPPGRCKQNNAFALVAAHLEMARRDPVYKFVLAEVDYLKPYFDAHPQDRAELLDLIARGRVEIMGGTYNEPNTNLTGAETAIRNFVHGIGFQRDVLGANPATAWQLDVFGHDPQFPGMAADAGLTSSSWARGPHHQWGPMAGDGDPRRMQFSSELSLPPNDGRPQACTAPEAFAFPDNILHAGCFTAQPFRATGEPTNLAWCVTEPDGDGFGKSYTRDESFTYDQLNRMRTRTLASVEATDSIPNPVIRTFIYEPDWTLGRTTTTGPDGQVTVVDTDNAGRPISYVRTQGPGGATLLDRWRN